MELAVIQLQRKTCAARPFAAGTAAQFAAAGFTLIELVVILLVLTVIFGMIGINLTRDDSDILRDEGDRLALLIQSAQEEAIMQARPFALTPAREGYEFLRLDDEGKLRPIAAGDLLGPRTLAARVAISDFEIDGVKDAKDAVLIFEPSGVAPTFTITLRLNETSWYIQGLASGKVHSNRTPLADAGRALTPSLSRRERGSWFADAA